MVFNTTFNNISVISWRSVLLVEETRVPKKTTDLPQATDTLYHQMSYISLWAGCELTPSVVIGTNCIGSCKSNIMLYHVHPAWVGFELKLVTIGTNCICSYKSNYHKITTMTAPNTILTNLHMWLKIYWIMSTLTGLTPLHICVCPKPGPGFPTSYVMILFLCSVSDGERWLFALLIWVELLTITV